MTDPVVEKFLSATRDLLTHLSTKSVTIVNALKTPSAPSAEVSTSSKPVSRPREFGAQFIQKLRGREPIAVCDAIFGEGDHSFDMPRPAKWALYAIAACLTGEKVKLSELKPVAEALGVAVDPAAVAKRVKRRLEAAVEAVSGSAEPGDSVDAEPGDSVDAEPESEDEPESETETEPEKPKAKKKADEPKEEPEDEDEPASDKESDEEEPEAGGEEAAAEQFSGKLSDEIESAPDEMHDPPAVILVATRELLDSNLGDDDFYPDEDAIIAEMGAFHWPHIPKSERKIYLKFLADEEKTEAALRYLSRGIASDALDTRVGAEEPIIQIVTADDGDIILPMCCYVPMQTFEDKAKGDIVPAQCYVCETKYSVDQNDGSVVKSPSKKK